MHAAGTDVQDIFDTLENTGEDFHAAIRALMTYFEPKQNVAYQRHVFSQITQETGETIDNFVTRIKTVAKTCDYGTLFNDMIRDQVIDKCRSNQLRRRLLREPDLDLDKAMNIARASEASEKQAIQMENVNSNHIPSGAGSNASVHAIKTKQQRPSRPR